MAFRIKLSVAIVTFIVLGVYCEDTTDPPATTATPAAAEKPALTNKPSTSGSLKPPGDSGKSKNSGNSESSGNSEKTDLKSSRYTKGCECEKGGEPVCSVRDQTYESECVLKCRGGKIKHKGKCALQ